MKIDDYFDEIQDALFKKVDAEFMALKATVDAMGAKMEKAEAELAECNALKERLKNKFD